MKIITLSLLKFLEDNGIGEIDKNLFWQKLGLGLDGLYIADIGASQSRLARHSTTYEIYSRHKDDLVAYKQLLEVANLLRNSYSVCNLPSVPPFTDEGFSQVTIMPPTTISNNGQDSNGRIVYSITGQIFYEDDYLKPPDPPVVIFPIITEDNVIITTENDQILVTKENQHE